MTVFYKSSLILLLLTLVGHTNLLIAQNVGPTATASQHESLEDITNVIEPNGWYYFKEGTTMAPGELFVKFGKELGLSDQDEMRLTRQQPDKYGNIRYRYQQYHQGIFVEGGESVESFSGTNLTIVNSKLMKKTKLSATPLVTKEQAEASALRHFVGEVYRQSNEQEGYHLPVVLAEKTVADISSQKELRYTYTSFDEEKKPTDYRLTWKFVLNSKVSFQYKDVYIDAVSGKLLKMNSRLHADGPANTIFHGSRWIDTSVGGGVRQMWAGNGGKNVFTRSAPNPFTTFNFNPTTRPIFTTGSMSDNWTAAAFDEPATAHWGVCEAYDYFNLVHGHDSWDDAGEDVNVLTNAGAGFPNPNAFFVDQATGTDYLIFGRQGTVPLSSIDIAAHEFTHGVVNRSINFAGGSTESNALNESFADIFGVVVEDNSLGTTNFILADADPAFVTANLHRNMINPGATGDPSIYEGTNWDFSNANVHSNGQVQNRWFTLLAQGGSQNGYSVVSIGLDDAAEIVYHSLTNGMLTSTATFADARANSIACAIDIFDECSIEHVMVTKAWAAVGIGSDINLPSTAYIEGPASPNKNSFVDYVARDRECFDYVSWTLSPSSAGTIYGDGADAVFLTFTQTGSVTVIYTGTHPDDGATMTIERTVNVVSNGGGGFLTDDTAKPTLRSDLVQAEEMTAFPNPMSRTDVLNIKFSNIRQGEHELVVSDMMGRQLFRTDNLTNGTNQFERLNLESGTYTLSLFDRKEGHLTSRRLIVQ